MSIAQFINSLTGTDTTLPLPRPPGPVYLPPGPEPPPPKKPRGRPRKQPVPTAPPPPSKAFPGRRVAGSPVRAKKRNDPLMRKTQRLTVYLNPVTLAALRRVAHRRGTQMSSFVADCLWIGITITCPSSERPDPKYW